MTTCSSLDSTPVAVRNLDGSAVTTIPESEGPVSPVIDNGLLYISQCGEHKIDVIDTATLAVVRTIDATVDGGQLPIAVAGGRIRTARVRAGRR